MSSCADPINFLKGVGGPASDQGGSNKVLRFQKPYPRKSRGRSRPTVTPSGSVHGHQQTCLFAYGKTKAQISCTVTAQLIRAFVYTSYLAQSLYFLNPNLQTSSYLLWLYSLVCVRPGGKPQTGFLVTRLKFLVIM